MKEYIGILGGMGPEASHHLYKNILHYCQKKYGAVQDTDYPYMLINNIGLEGFDETGIVDHQAVKKGLLKGIQQLDKAGVDKIYMACNTVHIYYDYLQKKSQGKIVNLIEKTCNKAYEQGHRKLLVLSSRTTNMMGLYNEHLLKIGIEPINVTPKEQGRLDNIIEHVMGGITQEDDFKYIENISEKYKQLGATAVIIGCTELPLATCSENNSLAVFDTIQMLTEMISESTQKKGLL